MKRLLTILLSILPALIASGKDVPYSEAVVTAQVDRVLGTAGRTRVQTVNFYDSHERLIYTSSTTADGSTIKTDTEYDFAGNPVKVRRTTVAAGQTMTDTYAYGYDRLNRPTTVTLSHNGGDALTLVSNTYDALGRLRSNGAPGKAKTYYDYDLRGALNKLTSNHFTQSLYRGTGKYSSRSGRITRNDLNVTGRRLISDYLYDHAGRLTRAEAKLENTGVDYTQEMEYDLNANVTAMRRYGAINAREGALLDDLTIEYQGNRMEFVTDDAEAYPYEASLDFRARAPIASTPGASVAAPFSLLGSPSESPDGLTPNPAEPYNPLNPYNYAADFAYDANGNMTQDRHSAITSISYNVLNLPAEVLYEGLLENRPVSQMVYDAAGRKHIVRNGVKKLGAFTGDVTRYVGDYIIVNDTVDRLQTPYGYLRDGEFHSYVFDYQGNVMVVVSGDKVDQTNLYYADGLPMNVSTDATANRFKYSAKELSLFRGLPVYDYTARHTLPQLSNTFRTMDPCAESFYSISPYSYCGGDPINYIDPTGQYLETAWDIGNLLFDVGAAIYDHVTGDHKSAKEHWVDAAIDVTAVIIPGVPAGVSKAVKTVDKTVDATKAIKATKAVGTTKAGQKAADTAKGVGKAKNVKNPTPHEIGTEGEKRLLKDLGGGTPQKSFDTSMGKRRVDVFKNEVAHESKVGRVSNTSTFRTQVRKDAELLSSGQVKGVEWHLYDSPVTGQGGLTTPAQQFINKMMKDNPNFKVTYHGPL